MIKLKELPIGLKGGFLDSKVVYELDNYWLTIPIKITEDVDLASAECYDINLSYLPLNSSLARVKTPLFRNHYIIIREDGKREDYSMFFDEVNNFGIVEILSRNDLYKRDKIDIIFGFPVTYRLYKEKEGRRRYVVGLTLYLDGIEILIKTYVGNGKILDEYWKFIGDEINFSPVNERYKEIVDRERYNLEKIVEDIKSF